MPVPTIAWPVRLAAAACLAYLVFSCGHQSVTPAGQRFAKLVAWAVPTRPTPGRALTFDTITVIHLPRRTDRLERMLAIGRAHRLDFEFLEATPADSRTVSGILDHVRQEREYEGWCLSAEGCHEKQQIDLRQSFHTYFTGYGPDAEQLEAEATENGWSPDSIFAPDAFLDPFALETDPEGRLGLSGADLWPDGSVEELSTPIPVMKETSMLDVLRDKRKHLFTSYEDYNRRHMFNGTLQVRALPLANAEVACWHSHVTAMRNFLASGKRSMLILEDDVDMEWDVADKLEEAWRVMPEDFDSVFVGHCWSHEEVFDALDPSVPYLRPSHSPKCNHAYAVSRRGAIKILAHLRSPAFAYSMPLDRALIHLIATERIKSFSFYPSPIIQAGDVSSDIQPDEGKKWEYSLEDSTLARLGMSVERIPVMAVQDGEGGMP